MKKILILSFLVLSANFLIAQSADNYFHQSSKLYVDGLSQDAKKHLEIALNKYPNDPKLNALNDSIEEEPPEDQENQDQENQDQEGEENEDSEDQEQEDSENKDQEGEEEQQDKEGEEGEEEKEQQQQEQEGKEGDEEENKESQPSPSDQMQEMKISEEKAQMILEALKNSEVQYIQQNRRKPTKKKDSDKPDW